MDSAIPHLDFSRWALNIAPLTRTELPEGNGRILPVRNSWHSRHAAFRRVAVPGDRAVTRRSGGGIDSIPKRDMPKGIILGMLTPTASGRHDRMAQPVGRRRRDRSPSASRASRCSTASAPSMAGALRKLCLHCRRRADRELSHHHLRQGPANLLIVPGRIFPAGVVGDASRLQDAASRDDRRGAGRAGGDVHRLVRGGLG